MPLLERKRVLLFVKREIYKFFANPKFIMTGIVYLYMKTPERAHSPAKMWERKKLSKNYAQALAQVRSMSIWYHVSAQH